MWNHLTTISLGLPNAAAMNPKQRLLLACLSHLFSKTVPSINFTNLESSLGSGVSSCVVLREFDAKELWQGAKGVVLEITLAC